MLFSSSLLSVCSIFCSGSIVMLHASTHHPIFVKDHVLSFAYPFNRSVVPSFQVLPILSSFASLLNRSAVWNLSYPLCHSFNSSRGSVLLISSSILSSCQVHAQFIPFTVRVLSNLYHSYSFSILFNRSVVSIIPLLTGVSSKCFHIAKCILLPSISNWSAVRICSLF